MGKGRRVGDNSPTNRARSTGAHLLRGLVRSPAGVAPPTPLATATRVLRLVGGRTALRATHRAGNRRPQERRYEREERGKENVVVVMMRR
jgi:hypothetical protein